MVKNINWSIRLKDKKFVVGMTGLSFLFVKQVLVIFGVDFDITVINEQVTDLINTAFVMLFMLGFVEDPTTEGISDSQRALAYTEKGKHELKRKKRRKRSDSTETKAV